MVIHRLLLDVTMPKGHWARVLANEQPEVVIRVEEKMIHDADTATYRVALTGYNSSKAIEVLEQDENVEIVAILENEENKANLTFTATNLGDLQRPLLASNMIKQTPFCITGGKASWSFATDRDGAMRLRSNLKDMEIEHRILAFGGLSEDRLLTPRQRFVFDAAVSCGYYDRPRKMNMTELSHELAMSKSSLCEMLHQIEKVIMHHFAHDIRIASPLG